MQPLWLPLRPCWQRQLLEAALAAALAVWQLVALLAAPSAALARGPAKNLGVCPGGSPYALAVCGCPKRYPMKTLCNLRANYPRKLVMVRK